MTAKADVAFREKTITVLTRLDTQMTQLMEERKEERALVVRVGNEIRTETKAAHDLLLQKFVKHDEDDTRQFEALRAAQGVTAGRVNRLMGGVVAFQFVATAAVALWQKFR